MCFYSAYSNYREKMNKKLKRAFFQVGQNNPYRTNHYGVNFVTTKFYQTKKCFCQREPLTQRNTILEG